MMTSRMLLLTVTISILATSTIVSAQPLPGSPLSYGPPRLLGELQNRAITESSGLAASRCQAGRLWTHNDSGDTARIFALDLGGRQWAEFLVPGAQAVDWEDMASFALNGRSYLVLADVGDNARRRPDCTLYLVTEPQQKTSTPQLVRTVRFQYEGGPVDCEALAIDPASQTALLVSKVFDFTSSVYQLDCSSTAAHQPRVARRIARIPIPLVTGMDITADGRRAVIVTYGPAYEYSRRTRETWQAAFARQPTLITLPHRKQGEAICYSPDGRRLYLTSEGERGPLWEVRGEGGGGR